MKKIYLCIIFTLLLNNLVAQKPFVCTPATHLSVSLPANTFTTAKISMVNQTSGSLSLKWLKFTNTIPSTWAANLCDYNTCYTGIPNLGTMSPISGLTEGFIKIEVNPFANTGSATVVIYVYSGSAPTLGDTLVFNFTASGVTNLENQSVSQMEEITMTPDFVHLQNYSMQNDIFITDVSGKVYLQKSLPPFTHEVFCMTGMPTSIYLIRTRYKTYKYIKY